MSARQLCELAAGVLGVRGAGVMLMSGEVAYGSLCTTNEVRQLIEELQYNLGRAVRGCLQPRPSDHRAGRRRPRGSPLGRRRPAGGSRGCGGCSPYPSG